MKSDQENVPVDWDPRTQSSDPVNTHTSLFFISEEETNSLMFEVRGCRSQFALGSAAWWLGKQRLESS